MNENKNEKEGQQRGFLYNHSEVLSGVIFFILVFVGMAVAAHFMN